MMAVAIAAAMPLMADTEYANGYTWRYYPHWSGNGVSISEVSPKPTGALTIPSTLSGQPVTEIEDQVFANCNDLTSVTIPNSVTRIREWAFIDCSGLTSVTIGNGVKYIGYGAFRGCSGLTSVTIPSSVTTIDEGAFRRCSGLTSVTILNSMTSIEEGAFAGCYGLADANGFIIVQGVLFDYIGTASEVTIPSGVKRIGREALSYRDEVTNITVPSSVTDIGRLAFAECERLKTVTLPKWCKNQKMYYDGDEWQRLKSGKTSLGRTLHDDEYIADFVYYLFADDNDGESYASVKKRIKITYKDVKGSGGGAVPEAWQKVRTLKGKATRALPPPYDLQGAFELKCGKANKQGVAKVSATLTGLDGKKKSYKAQSVDVTGKAVTVNLNGLSVTIDGDSFSGGDGLDGGLSVSAAEVGGNWTRTDAKVQVAATSASLPAGTLETLLPTGEPVLEKGGKWAFNKAATVKLSKDKTSAEWDDSKGKSNRSGLKLTYTPKKGTFKGSFKVYALEGADGAKKLKKYTANVTGVVVDGKGSGLASIKKPAAGPWPVTVE